MNNYKSWIEISKKSLIGNLNILRKSVSNKVKILSVVKSNAYGHGLREIVQLLRNKTDWFGVDNIDEAINIRLLGIRKPILILGYVPKERLRDIVKYDVSIALYNRETLDNISSQKLKKPIRLHLKIETGMNRQGILTNDLKEFANKLKLNKNKYLLEGIYTHFSDTDNIDFIEHQFKKFQEAVRILKGNGFKNLIKHCAASAGIVTNSRYHLDMVRAGIGLYGYWPSKEIGKRAGKLKVTPVLAWRSSIAQIKYIKKGEFVGYGRAWIAKKKSKIAIIPSGYFDGFDRGFSNNGSVLVRGQFANIIGRVAMNMFMIDITGIGNMRIGDEVVLIGKQGRNTISADDLAHRIDTIPHEVLARINPLLPRMVV